MIMHTPPISGQPSAVASVRKLYPPDFLVHVGAGRGEGPMACWREWSLENVLVINADHEQLEWVGTAAQGRNWRACGAVLASSVEAVLWAEANDPAESGVLTRDQFLAVSGEDAPRQRFERYATSLDELVRGQREAYQQAWLLIECFPVLAILQGGSKLLARTSVAWVRVVLEDQAPEGMGIRYAEQFLSQLGFVLLEVSTGQSPLLGYALFARNRAPELLGRIAELESVLAERSGLLEAAEASSASGRETEQKLTQLEQKLKRSEHGRKALEEQVSRAEQQLKIIEDLLLRGSGH